MLEIEKLSEKNLYDVLCYIFPDVIVEHNKMIQDAHRKYFVDYYFELSNHIVIVEFDGPRHFCNTLNEIRDRDLTLLPKKSPSFRWGMNLAK